MQFLWTTILLYCWLQLWKKLLLLYVHWFEPVLKYNKLRIHESSKSELKGYIKFSKWTNDIKESYPILCYWQFLQFDKWQMFLQFKPSIIYIKNPYIQLLVKITFNLSTTWNNPTMLHVFIPNCPSYPLTMCNIQRLYI